MWNTRKPYQQERGGHGKRNKAQGSIRGPLQTENIISIPDDFPILNERERSKISLKTSYRRNQTSTSSSSQGKVVVVRAAKKRTRPFFSRYVPNYKTCSSYTCNRIICLFVWRFSPTQEFFSY